MNILRILLFPFALLYGLIVWFRNKLFDWKILPQKSFPKPIIGIGNLSSGGTGKTPHVEYLVRLLSQKHKVAVLSRGYRRKTGGFRKAGPDSSVADIGDEPLQMQLKFPNSRFYVCESRVKGVKNILEEKTKNQVIVLDDVFQHRYIKPGLNILLTDYHRIFTNNYLLPTGNLREPRTGAKRADALVVTKTPSVFSPLDKKLILDDLKKYGIKNIFFSYIKYSSWIPVNAKAKEENLTKAKTVFLLTGIANPTPLGEHLKRLAQEIRIFKFSDHHQFKAAEIQKIADIYRETFSASKAIVTTEKDSMRLRSPELKEILKHIPVYYVPIEVDFHNGDKELFNEMVWKYVDTAPKE